MLILPSQLCLGQKIKVACIGDSVTFGYGIIPKDSLSYPSQLGQLLGAGYQVENFGRNGATLLRRGHNPYLGSPEFNEALTFEPDIAVIHLGLNDTDPRNWPRYQADFGMDFAALIDTLRQVNPTIEILIAELSPIFSGHPRFKSGTRDWHKAIREEIRKVSIENQVKLLDFYSPLHQKPNLFPDQIHPTAEGATIIAQLVYDELNNTQKPFTVNPYFSHGAVLQEGEEIKIFGTGPNNTRITVQLADKKLSTKVQETGKWEVAFRDIDTGGPYGLEIISDEKNLRVDSLYVGEVWLAMGQSNMAWPSLQSNGGEEAKRLNSQKDSPRFYMFHPTKPMNQQVWDSATLLTVQNQQFFQPRWYTGTKLQQVSGLAYFFSKEVQQKLNKPVGIIQIALGGAPLESFLSRGSLETDDLLVDMLAKWKTSDFIMPWVRQRVAENLGESFQTQQRHPYEPSYIHETAISALKGIPVKGLIWYQGESNTHNPALYRRMFNLFLQNMSQLTGSSIPIYMIQLPALSRPEWPYFREMQEELARDTKDIHLISTIDLGDSLEVHPSDKNTLGIRLANKVMKESYGMNHLDTEGPGLEKVMRQDNELILHFRTNGPLTTTDELPVRSFELLGIKGERVSVVAELSGQNVMLSIPPKFEVKSIWYAFNPFPRVNLTDQSGLPARPFRYDLQKK